MSIVRAGPKRPLRAVVMGSLTKDHVICGGARARQIGGVVWYAGRTLVRLGIETRVVTRTASKDYELGRALEAAGVGVWLGSSAHTTTFVNEYAANVRGGRTQRVLATADAIEPGEVSGALVDADLIYLGPVHPNDLSNEMLSRVCRRAPLCLALDVQGYTRVLQNQRVLPGLDARLPNLLDACDVIKASEEEARLITGSTDGPSAAVELACRHPSLEVVVTRGAKGVCVAESKSVSCVESRRVDVHDPTGAGDVFFASYIAGRLDGASRRRAAELAADLTAEWLIDADRNVRC